MLLIAIKNNLKLMFRSKVLIILLMFAPVGLSYILSDQLKDMMGVYENTTTIKVGYMVTNNTEVEDGFSHIDSTQIDFQEYSINEQQVNNTAKKDDLAAFLFVEENQYRLYENGAYDSVMPIVRNTIISVWNQVLMSKTYGGMEHEKQVFVSYIEPISVSVVPIASALDYYPLIELVYFSMCGVICVTMVISSERKNRILKRYRIAKVSRLQLYLSKFIPCVLCTFSCTVVAGVVSKILIGNNYGSYGKTVGILFLVACTSSAFGLLAFSLFKNLAVSISLIFISVWITGFFGGSFLNYMINDVPEMARNLSPIYYANRTLIEYLTLGESNITGKCIIILTGITVICSVITIILSKREMEEV